MDLFGLTKQEISWRRFASEVGGTLRYFPRFYFWDRYQVLVHKEPWTIKLDTHSAHESGSYTLMSAPFTFTLALEQFAAVDFLNYTSYQSSV